MLNLTTAERDALLPEAEKLAAEMREVDLAVEVLALRARVAGMEAAAQAAPAVPQTIADSIQALVDVMDQQESMAGLSDSDRKVREHLVQAKGWLAD